MTELVVGSRGSQLALRQTQMVMERLTASNPEVSCRIRIIKTTGDKITDVPLAKIGDKGLFVNEIEQAMLRGEIDLAVHSAKDLPSEMPAGLHIAAYPERVDPADGLVSKAGLLDDLPAGSVVGTSSIRRRAQILRARPDIRVADLRGNLDTRLRKLDDGQYDAIILACAGLLRMGWGSRLTQRLPYDVCLPAAGQGAIAVQCREGSEAAGFVRVLDDDSTRRCVCAERALLTALGAGCQTPVAALAIDEDGAIRLDAVVAGLDGTRIVRMTELGPADSPEEVGAQLADRLLASEAVELMEEARNDAGLKGMGAA